MSSEESSQDPGTDLRVAQRTEEAVRLRIAGLSFRAVGRQIGIGKDQVQRLTLSALRALAADREDTEALLELELQRLDSANQLVWTRLIATSDSDESLKGESPRDKTDRTVKMVAALLGIIKQRASLLGLEAPTKITFEGHSEAITASLLPVLMKTLVPFGLDAEAYDRLTLDIRGALNSAAETIARGGVVEPLGLPEFTDTDLITPLEQAAEDVPADDPDENGHVNGDAPKNGA